MAPMASQRRGHRWHVAELGLCGPSGQSASVWTSCLPHRSGPALPGRRRSQYACWRRIPLVRLPPAGPVRGLRPGRRTPCAVDRRRWTNICASHYRQGVGSGRKGVPSWYWPVPALRGKKHGWSSLQSSTLKPPACRLQGDRATEITAVIVEDGKVRWIATRATVNAGAADPVLHRIPDRHLPMR